MNTLIRLLVVIAFGVLGGFLVWLAGGYTDRVLYPEGNLFRVAGLALFTTFTVVFGMLALVWPASGQSDSHPWP
jgi:hypothetical protein